MQDNRDDLYLNLRDAGVGEDVIGTQQDFKNFVTNEKNTRDLYKNLRDAGVGEDVIGTEDDFYNFVAPDFSGNKSSGTTKVGSAAQQVVNEYDQSAKDNAKAPEDLSAATAGAKIGGNISLTPAKPNNQQTAQPAVDNTAKSVMDANGTPVEQPKATGPKTQFVSEDPNYVSGTPKEEALKKYPWMQPNQVYLWNKTTKEPVVSYFDENGQAVTDEDLQIKKAKSEITGQEDTEYMHPEAAALQLPNGNTRGVRLKKGALTQMADEIMRKEYGDNYLNTQFGRDGNVYTGAERRDLGAQQLYDELNSDVRNARISFAVADEKDRNEILSRIKAKWGKVADETSLVNAVSDENAAKEDIDIVAQQNINDLNAEIQNISRQMDQRGAEIDNASSPFVDQTFNARDVDAKYRLLQSKLNYAQNALKSWENVKNSGSLDALAGFKDAVMDISAWDFGFSDLKNAVSLLTAKGKDKQELVNLYGRSAEAAKFEDKYNPDSYRYGKIAGTSIPYALQFAGTDGGFKSIGSALSKKATSIAEKYALEGLKKQVVKGLGVAVGDIARAYTMSGTVQGLNTISDILTRSAGELTVDKQGNYQLKSDEPLLESIYKGVTASAIQNFTEMVGESVNISANLMRMLPKIGLGRVSNAITKIGTQDWYRVCNNWLSRAGVNDFGGEVLEEELSIILNAAFVGDNPLLNGSGGLLDVRTQKDILGGMLYSISAMRAGALAMYGVKKGVGSAFVKTLDMYDKMQLNQSDKGGQSIFGEGWTEIKDEIDNTPNDKVNAVIEKLAKEHPSKDEQSAIIDYAVKLLKTRGHNLGISMASDGENDEGAQEEVKDMPDLSQPNAEYLNKDDGMIHKASLYPDASDPTGTAKDVFIIKGNLVTNEDGSINKDASDKTIIYIDGNDEVHIASPDKFAAAYPPISNNEVQQANEGGEDEEAQATGNYNKGDEVNINVNGINYTAIIQGKDGFENYNVYYEDEDGMMHPAKFTADQLNEMNGRSTVSNGQQATSEQPAGVQQQVEQQVVEQPAQQEKETQQAQEEQKPAIPTDEKGNMLYHQVPVETTIKDLYDGKLDDNEIRDFVDANINEADKQLEKINKKAPKIGTNKAEYLKKKLEWQNEVDEFISIRDYWNSVKDYIAKQTHTTPEEIQAAQDELSGEAAKREYQGMVENIQQDPISVASDFIRGAKITPESFKAETGYGNEEQRKFVGMIAKAENGGKSIDRLAEELVSYDNAKMNGSLFGGDTSSAKDAILSALQGAGTRGDLKQTNEAEEQAYVDARNAARDAQYMEQYGMTYEEYLAYEEQIMPTIWREYNNYDETAFNNMYAEEIEQLLKSRENDTTGEKPTDDRGNKVLPEQQVNQQPGSEGGTEQGTKIQAGVQSNNENAVAPEETQQEVGVTERRIEEKPYATIESKGGYVNLHRERYLKDGITYTHAVAIRNGKAVNMPTALFPIPKYMEILDVPEGVSVLGINELREDSKGNSAATVVVRYEDGGTGKMDVRLQPVVAQKIANAEAETDTNPTDGQKEAGNYKKGHVRIDGYDISIEQPKGSVRRGTDANGKQWEQKMNNTYGYIRGTEGVDGDHIDIFLSDNPTEGNVYVVDQVNPDGSFDEHKVMYGFNSADEARAAYLSNYEEGWQGLGTITEVSKDEFKKWVNSSKRKTKPFSEYKSVNAIGAQNEEKTTDKVKSEKPAMQKVSIEGIFNDLNKKGETKLSDNAVSVEEDKTQDNSSIQGLQGYSRDKIKNIVKDYVEQKLSDADADAKIKGVEIHGSRNRGDAREDSDLDVVIEYEGDIREDDMFNLLNGDEDALSIEDIRVDINPIREQETGTLDKYMERSRKYDEEKKVKEVSPEILSFRQKKIDELNAVKDEDVKKGPSAWYFDMPLLVSAKTKKSAISKMHQRREDDIQSINNGSIDWMYNAIKEKGLAGYEEASSVEEKPAEEKRTEYGANNKVVSKERYEELKKRLIKKLSQLNFGMDPELIEIGCEMTAYHLEAGARKFADYAKAMINDVGDVIRPYLKSLYNAARDYPDVVEAGLNVGMSTGDEVSKFDVTNFDKKTIDALATADNIVKEQNIKKETEKIIKENEKKSEQTAKKSVSSQKEVDLFDSQKSDAQRKFSDIVKSDMLSALDSGEKPYRSIVDLRKRASEVGMDVDNEGRSDILLQELVEDGLVGAAREVVNKYGSDSKDSYDLICKLYDMQPTIAARSSNRIKMQQYSTPLPMAWNAAHFAMSGKQGGKVLEPTAGNGMLVFAVPANQVHANELDETRLNNLREQGFAKVTQQDATEPFEGGKQYDAIIANPPFGSRKAVDYDGKMIPGLDPQITLNALSSMKDDGKAAIIIGGNMEYAKNGSIKSMKPFFTYLYDHYNVKGVVDMDGKLYAKQGTTFPTRMILIDGRRSEEERAQTTVYPPVESKAVAKVSSFEELYNTVNDIINSKEKTNGTEILHSRERELLSINNRPSGNTEGNRRPEQPRKNDTTGRGNKPEGSKEQSERVLPGERGKNTGDGETRNEVAGSEQRGSRGNNEPAIQRVGGERVLTERVGLKEEPKKRSLTEEKLPYRPHNTAFSLNSVAPSAMVEAMDKILTQIEKENGSIDEFVRKELGYDTIEEAHQALAAEQMDSVAMAIYQMKRGQALIIGDQTGVGKGRQMAALIRWAVKRGEKPIFITQKADLFSDIYRDLVDVGSGDLVPFIFNSDGAMVDSNGNVVHKPLSASAMSKVFASGELPDSYDFAVLTYSQVNTGDAISQKEAEEAAKKSGTRAKKSKASKEGKPTPKATFLRAIAKDNYLFLDESHTAAGSSNTGAYLQSILKSAKAATFASATFAKRPDTMPLYAIRTAMSQAKIEPEKLISIIEKGGVTLQEIMSRELTNAGQMVRRERDMSDVKTDWKTIDDPSTVKRARENYDKTIQAFNAIIKFQNDFVKPKIDDLDQSLAIVAQSAGVKKGTDKMGVENVPFASKTYNYTKQLMLALKVDAIADEVEKEINAGRHPVIALESTMESTIKDYSAGEVIKEPTFSASLLKGLDSVMQYTIKDEDGKETHARYAPSDLGKAGEEAYYNLQKLIRESTSDIFISPLDAIIERLHEKGYKVGELTGRNLYVERNENGEVVVKRRTDKDKKKMQRDFNSGNLDVLILNKSASTGISLHASEKFKDQRQRTMIIAQPLSDINDYMQMIGRIDRTGQVHRGYYINLGLPVPAENRFLMMLSTKLKSLNANTTTSQDSKSNEVEAPDLLNKYGSQVVVEYLRDNPEVYEKMGAPLKKGGLGSGKVQASELDEYKPQDDDARKITGYVALLSTKEQEDFYNDVVKRYNDLIQYLNDTGSNDLKINVMPLRAKTLEKRVSSEGIDPNGTNPFAQNAYVEKVEMDVLRKPMKADEVKKTIDKLNKTNIDATSDVIRKESDAKIASENARYENAREKALDDIQKQKEKIERSKKLSDEEKVAAINSYITDTNNTIEERHDKNLKKITDNRDQLIRRLRMFDAGKSYLVPDNLESMTFDFASPAIFCGYKAKESKVTASTTLAVFATLDSRRRIEIKLSDINALQSIIKMTMDNIDAARAITIDNWDSQIPTETRKEGYILTGNILQAIADSQDEYGGYTGHLVSYTDIDGNIHDGILMPDKWNTSLLKSSGAPLSARMEQIKRYEPIVSSDGKVTLNGSQWAEMYYLTVPKTKKDGAMYYENKVLLDSSKGVFYPYRGKLRADIPAKNIEGVVKELTKLGVKVRQSNDVVSESSNTNEKTNDLYREADTEEEINSIIDKAKADGTYMKAPNGNPTNLNERQWAQVRTKAFKDWFGDWENDPENASKVVDENGEPKVVYHGSRSKSRINVFEEVYEKGTFFSTSKNVGSIYSSNNPDNLYSAFINAKNPLIVDNKGKDWNKIDAEDLIEAAEKMFNITKEEFLESLGEDRYITTDGIVAAISRLSEENKSPYDGLILKNVIETNDNEIATDVVAIKSNQIKSATDNIGAFSPENNDIRYRFIGETGARNLDAAEEATTRLDNLSVAREMENAYNEKKARIEKLKDSKPVDVKYNGEYDLNRKPAKDWLKENVRGEYTNNDTGEKIGISKVGINEVTSHGSKDKAHLKSLIAIPQMIEQSIFIDEIPNTKGHDKYDSYKYYVCGLKIDNVDYIVKLVVGVKGDNKYYDHRLTEIEKGTLIDNLNGLSNSVAENQNANISYGKDTKLQSILQTNDRENARKIKLATGWERGADGKWRYETADFEYHPKGDARRNDKYKESEWYKELHVLEEKLFNGETLTDGETKRFDELSARVNAIRDNDRNTERIYLDDYVEDNELFKTYPELKQTKIDFVDLPNEEYSAKYNSEENRITVNQAKSIDDKSAIAHEVQHAIQHIEGFAQGSNVDNYNSVPTSENVINDIIDATDGHILDGGGFDNTPEGIFNALNRKTTYGTILRDYSSELDDIANKYGYETIFDLVNDIDKFKSRVEMYLSEAGEVEARNVEARINMTPEQRRQSLASETEDVAREDQLFIYDNLGASARQGTGALTDSELSNANDPTGKLLGEPSRTPAQQRAFAERERQRMADHAREVADILHLDNVEIVTDASTLKGRRAKAKGFYSRDNGKIVIVVPNHVDMADIEQTVLHEAVAHYGLRKLFGKNFDTFLYNVYNNASKEVREKITQLAAKHNWDFATATEEYLASLAEKTNFEDLNASWWDKIKSLFLKLLHSIGLKGFTGVSLTDNELRYILWRSYENLKNPGRYRSIIDEARDMSMQNDLKVGNYSVQNSRNNVAEKSDNVLYREAKEVEDEINNDWRDEYDKKLSKFSFKFTEAAQDAMRSVKILQDIIAKETSAPISDDENVYWRENRLSSVNKYEQEYHSENYFKPIVTEIANLVKYGARYNDKGEDIINSDNDILKYLIAKHGIERNNYFREREAMNARKPYEDQIKELQKQVEKGEIKEEDANKKIAKLQEQADKAEMKKRVDVLHKDYSGLTELFQDKKDFDTLASSYVSDFEKKFDTKPLWNAINRATKGTLRKAFVDGLISKESYENTSNMYEYYIPLRGWANDVASEKYNYIGGKGHSSKILEISHGRTSLADNPISKIGQMMQDAILQGNRNRMKQAVYNLAMNHDTSLLNIKRQWYQNMGTKDDPIWERVFPDLSSDMTADQVAEEVEDFESRMRELKKEGKATQSRKGLILRLHTTKREEAQHRISVAINGKEYNIFVNGNPRAAQAINGELNDVDRYGSYISKINRFLSQVYTSVNPEFVVTNYQRDAGFAASIVASTEPLSYQKEWAKNMTIYNPITTGVYLSSLIKKAKTGNINPNNKAERYMQEFLSNGGETGFTNMLSADDYKKQIKRDIKSINSVVSLPKAARAYVAFTKRANTVFEDATRYATYVTSREQGRTIDRSIRDAKEISLNFNTRGADGLPGDGFIYRFFRGLRRWMIFVNPSIQGLNKAGMAFRNHPLRSSMMIAGLPTLLGYALPAIMQAVVGGGDGDDDDKNVVESYKDLPKWVRRTNIAIPIGGNNFVTIPLSYELRVSYGLGEMMWEYGEGMIDKDEIAIETFSQLSDLLPVSFANGTVAQSISPTIARPFVDIIQNRNFYGKKIYNDSQFIEGYPEYMKAYAGTPKWLVKSTEVLNNVMPKFGADVSDKYTPGFIDFNPAMIDYLLSSYFGGLYNFLSKFGKTISMIWDEDMRDIQNVPILSRNWKNSQSGNPYNSGDRYKTYMKEYDLSKQRFNGYKKEAKNDVPEFLNSLKDLLNTPSGKRMLMIDAYKRGGLDKLNRRIRDIDAYDNERYEGEKDTLTKKRDEVKEELINKLDSISDGTLDFVNGEWIRK